MNFLLSLGSAILLILVFPRFNLVWLAPVALTPILIACAREARWKWRFLQGWAAGFVFWFGVCYWIQFVLEVHGGMGRWGGWATFALFAAIKGLHLAIFAALAGSLMSQTSRMAGAAIPAVAALWAGLERTHGELGFTWLQLGNAGIDMPWPMRLAPITGVYGLSFLFAMLGCAVALVILRRPRMQLAWLAAVLLIPFLPRPKTTPAGEEQVLVVQPNIDSEAQFTEESLNTLENNLALLSRAAPASNGAGLIVWPEAPAPFYLQSEAFREYIAAIARRSNSYFLVGAIGRAPDGAPLNSAAMVDPNGAIQDRYDKMYLVPFGEFVPPVFGWVNRITHEAGDFEPGHRVVDFHLDGHTIGAFICYESAFPDLVRQFTHAGANLLVNISNDGYFGTSAAREQHLDLVRMRAAENNRWILRATNDGITALVDPTGSVAWRMPIYRRMSANVRAGFEAGQTPYVRFGDWFAWTCLGAGVSAALLAFRRIAPF